MPAGLSAERQHDLRNLFRGIRHGQRLHCRGHPAPRHLCAVEGEGVVGTIAGRAIYDGSLDFAAAQKLADELGA